MVGLDLPNNPDQSQFFPVVSQPTLVWTYFLTTPCDFFDVNECPYTFALSLTFPATPSFGFFYNDTGTPGFFGVVSSTELSSYTFSHVAGTPPQGPFFFGDSATIEISSFYSATPEPNTLVLLCSGLLGFAGIVRRKLVR